jgi:hypothetical protein
MSISEFFKISRRAYQIHRSLGMRCAAGFMRNRGVPFEEAHIALLGRTPRFAA